MIKSGLIIGVVTLLLVVVAAAGLSPLCAPCVAIILGLAAGYLAGVFDKPISSGDSAKKGAIAGGIAGVLGMLGNIIAGLINAVVLGSMGMMDSFNQILGLPSSDPATVWIGQIIAALCIGIINLVLMAGIGAGGGAIWYQITGKKRIPSGTAPY
jgi:hypothetical protein